MSRLAAYGFGLGLVGLVAAPVFRAPADDSYPLSTYPMFAFERDRPRLYFAEGRSATGARQRVPPEMVANAEVMQAAATVRRAVAAGPARSEALCRRLAHRLADSDVQPAIEAVELVSAEFDPVAYFVQRPEPLNRIVHCRCTVTAAR
jgi:hypothetical protein